MTEKIAIFAEAKRKKNANAAPKTPTRDWRDHLLYTSNGQLQGCAANVVLILGNDAAWDGVVARNEFSAADASFTKAPPWDSDYAPKRAPIVGESWTDTDDTR